MLFRFPVHLFDGLDADTSHEWALTLCQAEMQAAIAAEGRGYRVTRVEPTPDAVMIDGEVQLIAGLRGAQRERVLAVLTDRRKAQIAAMAGSRAAA